MARGFAGTGVNENIAPPLQSNFAELRLAHQLADTGKLDVEGIEGKQVLTRLLPRKQRARITIRISIARDGPDGGLSCVCVQGLRDEARLAQARARACAFGLVGAAAMPPSRLTPRINCSGAAT